MTMNKMKVKEDRKETFRKKSESKNISGARKLVRFINVFGAFDRNQIVRAMPFILFVTVLLIGYIANSYYAERIIRDIDKTKTELKEKKAEHISAQSSLISSSTQSSVAEAVEPLEIEESVNPPHAIRRKQKKVNDK